MKQAHSRGFVHFSPARGASQHPCHSSGYLTRVLRTAATAGVLLFLFSPGPSLALAADPGPAPPSAIPEKPIPPAVEFAGGLLSVTAKDADVRAVMEAVAAKSGIEIVLDKTITGKVNAEFKGMKFEDGLKAVLKDVVGGGFSSEYVKQTGEEGQLSLTKVRIARIGKEAMQRKDVLRITESTLQDAVGEEVVFAKWGTGESEIPQSRNGFSIMRVSDDGTIYFVGKNLRRIYVYGRDGKPMKPVDSPKEMLGAQSFEVDHEGNVYFLDANRNGPSPIGTVYICRRDGTYLGKVSIPAAQAEFTPYAFIEDGVLRDANHTNPVYDFRKYLLNPEYHSARRRYIPLSMFLPSSSLPDEGSEGKTGRWFVIPDTLGIGLEERAFLSPYPSEEWPPGDGRSGPLGFDRHNRFYYLFSIYKPYPYRFYSDHGVGVFDAEKRIASYFRLKENDSYVHEFGNITSFRRNFDVDAEGNVFFLFTTSEGVHVYKYALGRRSS